MSFSIFVTGSSPSVIAAVPSVAEADANRKSVFTGKLPRAAEKTAAVDDAICPGCPARTGSVATVLLSPVLLILQAVKPAVLAVIARLRRVFFSIDLPVFFVMIIICKSDVALSAHF
jgi:hypothetical protein